MSTAIGLSRLTAAYDCLGMSTDRTNPPSIAYKRAIAAALTNQQTQTDPRQVQSQLHTLAQAYHTIMNTDPTIDISHELQNDPSQSGAALYATYSRIWKERGVAWMRNQEEPCDCQRCQQRLNRTPPMAVATPGVNSQPIKPAQMSGLSTSNNGGGSAWAKPPAILAAAATAAPIVTKSNNGKPAEQPTNNPTTSFVDGTTGALPIPSNNDHLQGMTLDAAGNVTGWNNNSFNTGSPLMGPTGSFLNSNNWSFPNGSPNGGNVNDFSNMNLLNFQTLNGAGLTGLDANALNKGFNNADLNKSFLSNPNQVDQWGTFNSQQQPPSQWNMNDASKSNALFPSANSTLPSPNSADSMDIVTNHFATLQQQHGGQLPVNQAALDSLIQSASAMPAGPEQQQLLAMIDMLLQLHTGAQPNMNQFGLNPQGTTGGVNQPMALQPNQTQGFNPNNNAFNGLGQNNNAFNNWNTNSATNSGNVNSGLNPNLPFAPLTNFNANQSIGNNPPSYNEPTNANSNASLLMNLDGHSRQGQQPSQQQQQQLHHEQQHEEPALAGVPANLASSAGHNDWMSQFQQSSQQGNHSNANASATGSSLLTEFSPLRPARTTTNAGYNDVPESGSPFTYDQYSNLSVTARPFQPTSQQSNTSSTANTNSGLANSFANLNLGGSNTLLLQQQLTQQQNELTASLSALQGSNRSMLDLVNGGAAGLSFDPNDPLGHLPLGSGVDRNERVRPRDPYGSQSRDGGYGDRDRGVSGGGRGGGVGYHNERRGGRVNDYARSGMDRFDYIQQQVNQAAKSKSRIFEEAGFLPPTGAATSTQPARGRDSAYVPDFATANQLQSLQTSAGFSASQQQMLANLLAQTITGEKIVEPKEEPVVLSAADSLQQLTTSPEFQSLSSEQQQQIYLNVQQLQAKQEAAAAARQGTAASQSSSTSTAPTAPATTAPPIVSVSPVLGALQSPLSSSVVNISASSKVEDVLAQIVKPDLAKLSELLRQQQVAITNAALGNSSTPAAVALPTAQEPQPDKSKLRPPKPRARRTEFPDETTTSSSATTTDGTTKPATTSTTAASPASDSLAASVDVRALGQLQSVLSNASLSHSARVAVIRNVSASASATAFANAFVNAIAPKAPAPIKEEEKVAPKKEEATPPPATVVATPPVPMAMRVRKKMPTRPPTATAPGVASTTSSAPSPDVPTPSPSIATTQASPESDATSSSTTTAAAATGPSPGRGTRGPRGSREPRSKDDTRAPRPKRVQNDAPDEASTATEASATVVASDSDAAAAPAPPSSSNSNDRRRPPRSGPQPPRERGQRGQPRNKPQAENKEEASASSSSTAPDATATASADATASETPASTGDSSARGNNSNRRQPRQSNSGNNNRRGPRAPKEAAASSNETGEAGSASATTATDAPADSTATPSENANRKPRGSGPRSNGARGQSGRGPRRDGGKAKEANASSSASDAPAAASMASEKAE